MQGDHEELKILLQKYLSYSRFNQKLSLERARTSIYREIIAKNAGRLIHLKGFGRLILREIEGHDPTTRIPLLDFCRPIFIGEFLTGHMSLGDSPSVRLNHDHRISLKQSSMIKFARALMAI